MATIDITDTSASAVHQQMSQFRVLVQRYHADPDYRRQVEADPVAAFREQGMKLPSNIAVRVLANTDDRLYIVLPPDPNTDLGDEILAAVAGGKMLDDVTIGATTGTMGSAGTLLCASAPSTAGCAGTASSLDVS